MTPYLKTLITDSKDHGLTEKLETWSLSSIEKNTDTKTVIKTVPTTIKNKVT